MKIHLYVPSIRPVIGSQMLLSYRNASERGRMSVRNIASCLEKSLVPCQREHQRGGSDFFLITHDFIFEEMMKRRRESMEAGRQMGIIGWVSQGDS